MPVNGHAADSRPNPDELLRRVQAAERAAHHGSLKIFLGYSSGVGKSFRMFDEGRRRHERGEDVIVAALQPDMDPQTEAVATRLETVAARIVDGVPVIDVTAVLRRRPQVALVDGLAYDNPPGSRHRKRYQDVAELLEAGIAVITSINLAYIAEQQD